MSKNLKNCYEKLKFIASVKDHALRRKLLNSLSDECLYKALNEIAVNVVNGKVTFNSATQRKLKKFKEKIKRLSVKTNNKKTMKSLVRQSGGFLPILIPAIASVVSTLLAR